MRRLNGVIVLGKGNLMTVVIFGYHEHFGKCVAFCELGAFLEGDALGRGLYQDLRDLVNGEKRCFIIEIFDPDLGACLHHVGGDDRYSVGYIDELIRADEFRFDLESVLDEGVAVVIISLCGHGSDLERFKAVDLDGEFLRDAADLYCKQQSQAVIGIGGKAVEGTFYRIVAVFEQYGIRTALIFCRHDHSRRIELVAFVIFYLIREFCDLERFDLCHLDAVKLNRLTVACDIDACDG